MLSSRRYYDRLAPSYDDALSERAAYVAAVERIVLEWARRRPAAAILDAGCGNGARLRRLLERSGLAGVGLDESDEMVRQARGRGIDAFRVDIASPRFDARLLPAEEFDLVACLWNVLGHVPSDQARRQALANLASLLAPGGVLVLDVNNRFNARHYGWWRVARNAVATLLPLGGSGDFVVRRRGPDGTVATKVHIFTRREIVALCRQAGLDPIEVRYLDYRTGSERSGQWGGQICVVAGHREGVEAIP